MVDKLMSLGKSVKQGLRKVMLALPGGRTLLRFRARILACRGFNFVGNEEDVFQHHYESNTWGDKESVSGSGSTLLYTESIRSVIPGIFENFDVKSILDAPCGDYNWFGSIQWKSPIAYIGADIVKPLIKRNINLYSSDNVKFISLNIINEKLPETDIWLCRDCLIHLSEKDIFLMFNNFFRSNIRYIFLSTYPNCDLNGDIPTGSARPLNLQIPPYNLGEPIQFIEDWVEGYPVRYLGLWEREKIEKLFVSNKAYQHTIKRYGYICN